MVEEVDLSKILYERKCVVHITERDIIAVNIIITWLLCTVVLIELFRLCL